MEISISLQIVSLLIHLLQALKEEIKDMHGLRITTGVPGW